MTKQIMMQPPKKIDGKGFAGLNPLVTIRVIGGGQDARKRDLVWWPTHTALDRQLVEVGVPFQRRTRSEKRTNGEWIVLSRSENGYLKSGAVSAPPKIDMAADQNLGRRNPRL